jgi:hypothetical protein
VRKTRCFSRIFSVEFLFFANVILCAFLQNLSASGEDTVAAPLDETAVVLRGIAFERYRIPELLKALGVEKVKCYTVTNNAPALKPANKFRLDKLPRLYPPKPPKYIIMADFPLNPGLMPGIVLKSIIRDVKRGSTLVVLGGLFTLNKGFFGSTALAPLLPVELASPWSVVKLKNALRTPGGGVLWAHDLVKANGADVLFESDGRPLWLSKPYGKGGVVVFLGIPSGVAVDGRKLFWSDSRWVAFAAKMINGARKSFSSCR